MKKIRIILLAAVLLVIVELTGIPSLWKNRFALLAGIVVLGASFLLNREIRLSRHVCTRGETVSNMYVDNGPRLYA